MDSSKYGNCVPKDTESALVRKVFAELLTMRTQVQSMREEIQFLLKKSKALQERAQATIDESQALRARRDVLLNPAECRDVEAPKDINRALPSYIGESVVCPDCGKRNVVKDSVKCSACGRILINQAEPL